MADTWFSAKEWKARLVEFAGRRSLRNVANGETATYDVSRSEGQVSQEGDAFNTKNMNDLEQRISNGFANAKTNIDALNRDFAGGQMEIRLTEAGKGEYRKKGADTWTPFKSEIRIINIFLPPHRDNYGHLDIDVSEYSTLFIGSVTTSGNHAAEIMGDDVLIGSYKHGDKNITVDISGIRQLRFRNGLKATDWSRYADFGNVIIK